MRHFAIRVTAVLMIIGGGMVLGNGNANAAMPCCYDDCLTGCMDDHSFHYCHNICNSDCEACPE